MSKKENATIKTKLTFIRAPKDFRFKIFKYKPCDQYDDCHEHIIALYHKDQKSPIGTIALHSVNDKHTVYETHSNLDYSYRGQGLGTLMYAKAIQFALSQGWKVSSSWGPSSHAQRVWESKTLRKFFRVRKAPWNSMQSQNRFFAYEKK